MQTPVNNQGSALLATIIVVGSIGLMLAGIARFTLDEIRSATALEDSVIAFSAAEAGLEEGLLRWRFDRNIELPPQASGQPGFVTRVNLTSGLVTEGIRRGSNLAHAADDAVYDLRMTYQTPELTSTTPLTSSVYPYKLHKDQTLELDASKLVGTVQLIYSVPEGAAYDARIETRIIAEDLQNPGTYTEVCAQCKQLTDRSTGRSVVIGPIPADSNLRGYRIRIKPFIFTTGTEASADSDAYINYSLQPDRPGSLIDSGVTLIESTGYFGSAQRTLVARVDRQSGTVLGVYDYALFTKESLERLALPPAP